MIALYILAGWISLSIPTALVLGPILNENGKHYPPADDA